MNVNRRSCVGGWGGDVGRVGGILGGVLCVEKSGVTGLVYLIDMGQRGIYEVSDKILEYLYRT